MEIGSLIEITEEKKKVLYIILLEAAAQSLKIPLDCKVIVITLVSPIGKQLNEYYKGRSGCVWSARKLTIDSVLMPNERRENGTKNFLLLRLKEWTGSENQLAQSFSRKNECLL